MPVELLNVGRSLGHRFSDTGPLLALLPALLILTALCFVSARPRPASDAPKDCEFDDWPFLGSALHFYAARREMLVRGTKSSPTGNFSFYVGKKHVISLSGPIGRKTFYESKELNFAAGFVGLLAGVPSAADSADEEKWIQYFHRGLLTLMRRQTLALKVTTWSRDIHAICNELAARPTPRHTADWRVLNPFDDLYELLYKLVLRVVGSNEIADTRVQLKWTLSAFDRFEKSSSTWRFIFPWLITPNFVQRMALGTRLYLLLSRTASHRRKSGVRRDDALQYLLDQGSSSDDIAKFQLTALWAGFITTGVIGCWVPVLLASHPHWKRQCLHELYDVVGKHRKSPKQSPCEVLDGLELETWESAFPIFNVCLRETIRLCLPGTVFRKNTSGHDVPIGDTGEVIPDGSFTAYLLDDVHLDANAYPDPDRFNPGRYLNNHSHQEKTPHAYVGWGSGRHPCLGMKVATVEITMVVAYFMTYFDFEVADSQGSSISEPPPFPNRNNHKAEKPSEHIYLRYRLKDLSHHTSLAVP